MTLSTQFQHPPPYSEKDMMPTLDKVVTVNNCYYYLALIERFWRLMDTMDRDQQRLYLVRAEFRYVLWLRAFDKKKMPIPPLDIAFMWHTHLLSPFRYYEDLVIRMPFAKKLLDIPIPLEAMHREANGPTDSTLLKWKRLFRQAGEPYELNENSMASGDYCDTCVLCKHEIRMPWTKYVGYRYGENTTPLDHSCGTNGQINFMDVARMKLEHDMLPKEKNRVPTVAGTLLGADGMPRREPNAMIPHIVPLAKIEPQNEMDYSYELEIQDKLKTLGKKYEHDANELLYAIRTCYQGNPSPFSLDLIHAVARQRRFYEAASAMDWSAPFGFATAIRRYHDFMVLLKNDPELIAVPTIEIDCAWHTHMLFAGHYRRFTRTHLKRIINHDDTIPESSLKKYSSDTCKAWLQSTFNYWITDIKPKGMHYVVSLAVDNVGFGSSYYPGQIYSAKKDRYSIAELLNGEVSNNRRSLSARVSAHCRDIIKSFYRNDANVEQLKAMQNFIGEGMKKTSYGYIGTVNCGTGGKSAIYSSDDRHSVGKIIYSDKPRWYHLRVAKIQNKYRNVEGSKSASHRFHHRSTDVIKRRKSRDQLGPYYHLSGNGEFINYRPNMYNKDSPESHGRRSGRGYAGAGIVMVGSACGGGGGGGGGGCGGGGGGGGGC